MKDEIIKEKKISKSIGILYRARDKLDSKELSILYCALVLPYLHYCVPVWGNTYKTSLSKLVTLQKRAIRIVSKVSRLSHSLPLFKEYKLLKFDDIIYLSNVILMYRVFNDNVPFKIKAMFKAKSSIQRYNMRKQYDFHVETARTKTKFNSFKIKGITLWNQIDDSLKLKKSMPSFKYAVKTNLFDKY